MTCHDTRRLFQPEALRETAYDRDCLGDLLPGVRHRPFLQVLAGKSFAVAGRQVHQNSGRVKVTGSSRASEAND